MRDTQSIVEELIELCLDRMATEGDAVIETVCTAHPEHAPAVRRILASLSRIGLVEPEEPQPDRGDRVGEYRLVRRIGGGAMGEVYLAEQQRLGRQVALKLIRAPLVGSKTMRERFRREIDAVTRLNHPGICPVYDAGEVDGTLYLAMRFVEGESLSDRLAALRAEHHARGGSDASSHSSSRQRILEDLELGEKMARALHAAHDKGLVHRDVKPGNVMVSTEGEPVLLDFGLARHDTAGHESLTIAEDAIGTPLYMAPEQVNGKGVDPRTDVYGLGATLFELLTLRCPHEAPTREAIFHEIVHGAVPSAARLNRSIPRDVDVVLQTALDPDPDRRYQSAAELAEDLRRVRNRLPISARPLPASLRVRRWVQRNPAVSVGVMVLGLGLCAALVLLHQLSNSLRRQRALASANEAREAMAKDGALALGLALDAVRADERHETLTVLQSAYANARQFKALEHKGHVSAVAYSPAGLLASCTAPGLGELPQAILWNADGEEVRRFVDPAIGSAHRVGVASISFSESGSRVVTGGRDGEAKVWDVESGALLGTFSSEWWLAGARFLAEDRVITVDGPGRAVAGKRPARVATWRLGQGSPETEFRPPAAIVGMDVAADLVLLNSWDGSVRVYSHEGKLRAELPHPRGFVVGAFAPDGARVATVTEFGRVALWTAGGESIKEVAHVGGRAFALEFSPDGRALLVSGSSHVTQILDLEGTPAIRLAGHAASVWTVAFAPDGQRVATGDDNGKVRIWDLSVPEAPVLRGHLAVLRLAVFSPDSKRILTVGGHTTRLWDARGRELGSVRTDQVFSFAAFAPGGGIATGEYDPNPAAKDTSAVRLWNSTLEPARVLQPAGTNFIRAIAFSPDGRYLVSAAADDARLFDLQTRKSGILHAPTLGHFPITSAAFAPSGDRFLVSHTNGVVWEHETAYPMKRRAVVPGGAAVTHVEYSPDGTEILTAHSDGIARLWPRGGEARGKQPQEFRGHESRLTAAVFCPVPGQSRIATASNDGTGAIWTRDGGLVMRLVGHVGPLASIRYSPDGTRLITAGEDGVGRVWIADPAELKRLAAKRLAR